MYVFFASPTKFANQPLAALRADGFSLAYLGFDLAIPRKVEEKPALAFT